MPSSMASLNWVVGWVKTACRSRSHSISYQRAVDRVLIVLSLLDFVLSAVLRCKNDSLKVKEWPAEKSNSQSYGGPDVDGWYAHRDFPFLQNIYQVRPLRRCYIL